MFSFVKMTRKWYVSEFDEVADVVDEIQDTVNNGDIIVLGDDLECFKDSTLYDGEEIIFTER